MTAYIHPFCEGENARHDEKPDCANPYLIDTYEHNAWSHGWEVADEVAEHLEEL